MSEPKSLFVNFKIKRERLEQFFQAEPVPATVDQDWLAWWNSRKMYSPEPLTQIPAYSNTPTNRQIADAFLSLPEMVCTEDLTQEGAWTFSVLLLTENYGEILPTLAWLAGIAGYMDQEDEGTVLIYDYFWGGSKNVMVMAHLVFKAQQVFIEKTLNTSEIEPALLEKANAALKEAYDRFSANYDD